MASEKCTAGTAAMVAVCLSLGLAVAAPASASREPLSAGAGVTVNWPTFHYTNDRAGFNASETALGVTTVSQLSRSWLFATGDEIWSSPAVVGGTLFIGSDDKKVYALNSTTGAKIWSYTTADKVRSSPAVAGGVVYVGSNDDKLYALNATTGTKIWSALTGGDIDDSSPLVVGTTVYIGSLDGYFYAFKTSDGSLLWKVNTWAPREPAAYWNGTIYVGSDKSQLFALDPNTGASKWTATLGGLVRCAPSVSGGVVYVGSDDYHVYAYDAMTGVLKWKSQLFPHLGIVRSSPAVWNGTVYVDTGETSPMGSHLYALNTSNGSTKWSTEMSDYSTSSPVVANGVVYTGSFDHQIHAFDATTGAKLWASGFNGAINGGLPGSIAVLNGWVYVGSEDDNVYGFTDTAGDPVQSYVAMTDNLFTPVDTIGHLVGTAVKWTNGGLVAHTVTDNQGMGLYDSGSIAKNGTFTFTFYAAGIYKYHCTLHTSMTGTVKPPMLFSPATGGVTTVFALTWATAAPPAGFVYDVRILRPGTSTWEDWKMGVTTQSATFAPDSGIGTYQFKAHMKKSSNGKSSNYSVPVSIAVS